ncbi:MAG: DNA polymerase III subunit delta [Rhodobacteraceae bacterium]|nr:DNA polymerase III subunit delta [Paracoccaceae bacterium]
MKLAGAQAAAFLARPDGCRAGVLLYGADAMRVALKRQALVRALAGPRAAAELRLTRMAGADLRRAPAAVRDALKAIGFFPGRRVVLIEEAGDGATDALAAALGDWAEGDATLVCTAGRLTPRSRLRKLFESAPDAVAIGIYDDPPGRDEIIQALKTAGLAQVPPAAMQALVSLARSVDPGTLAQIIEKLALYKLGAPDPVTEQDLAAILPETIPADVTQAAEAAAEGRTADTITALARLAGQGVTPVALCMGAARHFKLLYAIAAAPGGAAVFARHRIFGPRRDRLARQARRLGPGRLARALTMLMDTDLALRSPRPPPGRAAVERTLVRIALAGRG